VRAFARAVGRGAVGRQGKRGLQRLGGCQGGTTKAQGAAEDGWGEETENREGLQVLEGGASMGVCLVFAAGAS